jgi:hypothetical protein
VVFSKKMDECWKTLPRDLVERILLFLDAGTRRDLGMKPRRLTELPDLDLHLDDLKVIDESCWLNIVRNDGTLFIQMAWSWFGVQRFCFMRTRRAKFMNVNGIQIWRDQDTHMQMFTEDEEPQVLEAAVQV